MACPTLIDERSAARPESRVAESHTESRVQPVDTMPELAGESKGVCRWHPAAPYRRVRKGKAIGKDRSGQNAKELPQFYPYYLTYYLYLIKKRKGVGGKYAGKVKGRVGSSISSGSFHISL